MVKYLCIISRINTFCIQEYKTRNSNDNEHDENDKKCTAESLEKEYYYTYPHKEMANDGGVHSNADMVEVPV